MLQGERSGVHLISLGRHGKRRPQLFGHTSVIVTRSSPFWELLPSESVAPTPILDAWHLCLELKPFLRFVVAFEAWLLPSTQMFARQRTCQRGHLIEHVDWPPPAAAGTNLSLGW